MLSKYLLHIIAGLNDLILSLYAVMLRRQANEKVNLSRKRIIKTLAKTLNKLPKLPLWFQRLS